MDRANHALASYLANEHEVHVVSHRVWPDLASHANVKIHAIPRPFGRHRLGAPLLSWIGAKVAASVLRQGGRAVANGANCFCNDLNWVHFVHAACKKNLLNDHDRSTIGWFRGFLTSREIEKERRRISAARLIICNSRMTAQDLIEHVGVDASRLRVVYLSCDLNEFVQLNPEQRRAVRSTLELDDRPVVAFIGESLSSRKGFDVLYDAWRILMDAGNWDAQLLVVGAARRPFLDRKVEADGLGQSVRILGHRRDVSAIMSAVDLVVLPSQYEPYGLAAHESICVGTPALVSRRSGIAERLPSELSDLILDDARDATELAARLRSWRSTMDSWPARIRPLSDAFRAWTWEDMAAQIVELAGNGE